MKELVTCNHCGWVHFKVSRFEAEQSVEKFNQYYNTLTSEEQQNYYRGRKSYIKDYEHCDFCGGRYDNFRPFQKDDCPEGCTIGPIIQESE